MSDVTCKTVERHLLNLADYAHDDQYCKVDEIVHLNNPLRDIDEAQCRALEQSFCKYTFNNARGLTIVYVSAAVNLARAIYASAIHDIDCKRLFKDDYRMVMPDGRHQRRAVELVRNKDGKA